MWLRSRWSRRAAVFGALGLCASVALEAEAAKKVQVKAKSLRAPQIAEVAVPNAPPRVVATFSMPGNEALFGIACARKPKSEDPAHCVVFDDAANILDASVGLNVMRVKDARGVEKLELMFSGQWDKQTVHIEGEAPLDPVFIDALEIAFAADLSMIEFLTAEEGFPLGVAIDAGGRVEGDAIVFGNAGQLTKAELIAELAKPPPPLPPPAPPEPAEATGESGDGDGADEGAEDAEDDVDAPDGDGDPKADPSSPEGSSPPDSGASAD